jgi:hypothetical protein
MPEPVSNVEVLKAAGLIEGDLHEDYFPVLEDMSHEEMAAVMLLKARLDSVKLRGTPDWRSQLPL